MIVGCRWGNEKYPPDMAVAIIYLCIEAVGAGVVFGLNSSGRYPASIQSGSVQFRRDFNSPVRHLHHPSHNFPSVVDGILVSPSFQTFRTEWKTGRIVTHELLASLTLILGLFRSSLSLWLCSVNRRSLSSDMDCLCGREDMVG